jgi:RNA polymerase sigma factor (sigma-70 family)
MATDDDGLSTFLSVRARLFGVAYRILGCAAAAEDVVQDAWIRWQSTNRCAVRDAGAFLTVMATRLAINIRQSARSRRETWAAPGLPEPADTSADQIVRAERADALTVGVAVLLERLSSTERAAYILREAFDYAYRDIADVLHVQEANARQLVSRARLHLAQGRKTSVVPDDHRRLMDALNAAAQAGDPRDLTDLFAAETRLHGSRRKAAPAAGDSSQAAQDEDPTRVTNRWLTGEEQIKGEQSRASHRR